MKAIISPNEIFIVTWISAWDWVEPANGSTPRWDPIYSEIINCIRVAEVEPDNKVFEVAQPLYWIDCADDCNPNDFYFKDGQIYSKPQNEPCPPAPVEELP